MQDEKDLHENLEPQVKTTEENISEAEVLDPKNQQIVDLTAQIADLKDTAIRAIAENENLRKRQQRELENAHKYGSEKLLKDLIPVIDSLSLGLKAAKELAEKTGDNNQSMEKFIEGNEMTLNIFRDTLVKHGVEEINPIGEKFDPALHEAVAMVTMPDKQANTIIDVAQKGYVLNGRSIRAAQVIVAKGE